MSRHSTEDLIKNLIALGLLDSNGRGHLQTIKRTVLFSQFTDGGAAVGTYTFPEEIPAGAIMFCAPKVLVTAGFAGDVSAALTIGDGSDVDRYNTGTPSVFATAATGVDMGVPSGVKAHTAVVHPVLTVTTNADFTNVTAGSMEVTLTFVRTAD